MTRALTQNLLDGLVNDMNKHLIGFDIKYMDVQSIFDVLPMGKMNAIEVTDEIKYGLGTAGLPLFLMKVGDKTVWNSYIDIWPKVQFCSNFTQYDTFFEGMKKGRP